MDPVAALELALGAELLRAKLLGAAPPRIDGRYTVEGLLGRGASGVVARATDERLGREVALKLAIASGDPSVLGEARALAKLDHPNVVPVFDVLITTMSVGGTGVRVWVVSMQRVEGSSLRAWLAQGRSIDEIVSVFLSAGAGLAAAHEKKIVHRDFKPDNVVVSHGGIARVLDFGFAIPAMSTHRASISDPSEVAGTDPYMAPEARDGRPTRRSDQFSFAISMVEALTGEVTRPSWWRPRGVPRALWAALRRATATEQTQRFDDMPALLAAIDATRRPRGRSTIAAAAVLTIVAGLSAAAYFTAGTGLMTDARRWTSVLAAAQSDGGVSAERSAGGAGADAGPTADEAPVVAPSEPECPTFASGYFHTFAPDATVHYGCYSLEIDEQRDCVVSGEVEKVGSGSTTCSRLDGRALDDQSFEIDSGVLVVRGRLGERHYTLRLGPELEGTFESVERGQTTRGDIRPGRP